MIAARECVCLCVYVDVYASLGHIDERVHFHFRFVRMRGIPLSLYSLNALTCTEPILKHYEQRTENS